MANRIERMTVVDKPMKDASILQPQKLPTIQGNGTTDSVCGKCGAVIGVGISPQEMGSRMVAPSQLLIICTNCKAHNRVPAAVGN